MLFRKSIDKINILVNEYLLFDKNIRNENLSYFIGVGGGLSDKIPLDEKINSPWCLIL